MADKLKDGRAVLGRFINEKDAEASKLRNLKADPESEILEGKDTPYNDDAFYLVGKAILSSKPIIIPKI